MRYTVIPTGLSLSEVEAECRRLEGKNIKVAYRSEQVFVELEDAAVEQLRAIPGLMVKTISKFQADQLFRVGPPATEGGYTTCQPVYASSLASYWSLFYDFRELFSPPLTGEGLVCAILDTGIRKTHRTLAGKVTYEANFSDSPDCDDHFDHGTSVAYLVAGGRHALGEESGMAPGARVMNIKVLDDDGEGTTESVIMGINEVHDLFCEAVYGGLELGDPMYPNAVNMSFGEEDDGDPDNPVRLAIEKLYQASPGKFPIFCAAGNTGGPVLLPAAAEHAWAVGATTFVPFELWELSARGSNVGLVKPEMVFFGVDILCASAKSDDAFVTKSGTSFSSPLALGQLCLTREAAGRYGFLEELIALSYEELEPIVAAISYKPEGVPMGKTSDWGYGMPMGHLLAQRLGISGGDVDVSQAVTAMAGVAMVGMMMGSLARVG